MPMTETLRRHDSRATRSHAPLVFRPAASGRRRKSGKVDLNLHAYVGADPVNFTDPDGLSENEIVITAPPKPQNPPEPPRFGTFGPVSAPAAIRREARIPARPNAPTKRIAL